MWIRLHKLPKLCRNVAAENFTAKQRYYYNRSFKRYSYTEDSIYLNRVIKSMKPEIGRVDRVRFIESPTPPYSA
jgi:hypothetical protein